MDAIKLTLQRDGQCIPWGFKLVGSVDTKSTPLVIQKVEYHSNQSDEAALEYHLIRVIF